MPASIWGVAPRRSIELACEQRGRQDVLAGCITLLSGGDADRALVRALGGPEADRFLDVVPSQRYWLRVWGARGLLWNWGEAAAPALVAALRDDAWRVREMAARVAARHGVDSAIETLVTLQDDPVARVRAAAHRALVDIPRADDSRRPDG